MTFRVLYLGSGFAIWADGIGTVAVCTSHESALRVADRLEADGAKVERLIDS